MLACIACTKDGGEDTARADTASSKSLTSQIKDMVLKFSGLQSKGGGASSSASYRFKGRSHHRPRGGYADVDEDGASEGGSHYAYLREGSSSSTPAWDFTSIRPEGGKAKWSAGPGNAVVAPADENVVIEENSGEPKEWTALVEPGVQITFVSLPGGAGNDLKRIRFSREMFNKWQAQRWWGENFDRIMELYNVQRFSRQALPTPPRSDDGGGGGGGDQRESFYSRVGSTRESPVTPPFACTDNNRMMYRNNNNNNYSSYRAPSTSSSRTGGSGGGGGGDSYFPSVPDPTEHILPHHLFHHHAVASAAAVAGGGVGVGMRVENSLMDASRTTTSSRDEAASISVSNASDMEMTEWVEQDEPGVYITIRELPDGTRELRRVRFSREKFGEVHAKLWWEDNRERIQAQYL